VVLAALVVHCREAVSAERLADALWGDDIPASWPKVVQGCVVRLRRTLGKDAVKTVPGGYRLDILDDEVDARVFERVARRGRALAGSGEPRRAAAAYTEALSLWRGAALGDLDQWPPGRSEALRLTELRHGVHEALVEAKLQAGEDAVPDATALVTAEPLRERRWVLLATALYRQDRQAEALGALRQARRTLLDELGIDPSSELADLERAILNHDPGLAVAALHASVDRGVCPYRGLVAYDRDDAEWFFGRSDEVARCIQALGVSPLLVVVGPSGCGKSSLIGAGVIPPLERDGKQVAVMTPGLDPQSSLVSAISDPGRVHVLVVDQLEELFTVARDRDDVQAFLDRLADLAASSWKVITVVRADHLSNLAVSVAFSRLAERGMHLVTPMTESEMTQSIQSPATQAGVRLEPGLIDLLLTEVEGEPGALPLLSHALAQTWENREADVLTVDGYRATGGIRSAVSRSAELLYESLDTSERAAVRSILLRLVTPSPDGQPVAIRASYQTLTSDDQRARVLDLLVTARLVTTDEQTVALAHEAVVRAWPRLLSWLDEDIAGQRSLRHLSLAADDWAATGRPDSELYRGGRLESVLYWQLRERPDLTSVESEFLDASTALADREREATRQHAREQARSNRRLRIGLAGTAVGLALALVAGSTAAHQTRVANSRAREAQVQRLVAQSLALRGTRRDLAALLALQAYRLKPDATTRGALLATFTGANGFLGYLPTPVPLSSGQILKDGHTLLASGVDGVIREVDLSTGHVRTTFPAPTQQSKSAVIAVSADERTVAEVSWEGPEQGGESTTLSVFDLSSGSPQRRETRLPLTLRTVAVSPDGTRVAVSGNEDGRVFIFDTHPQAVLPTLPADGSVTGRAGVSLVPEIRPSGYNGLRPRAALAFTGRGELIVGSESGVVRIVDAATAQEVGRLSGAPPLTSNALARVSADGSALLTTGDQGVAVWDLVSHQFSWSTSTGADPCISTAFAPMISSVLCGTATGAVRALELGTGLQTDRTFDLQRGGISDLAVTPDGHALAELTDAQSIIGRWSLDGTGPVTRLLKLPDDPGGYSPDGRWLLAAPRQTAPDPTPEIVDGRSGRVMDRLTGYQAAGWTSSPGVLVAWDSSSFGHLIDAHSHRRLGELSANFELDPESRRSASSGHVFLAWGLDTSGGGTDSEALSWRVWDERTGEIVAAGPEGADDWTGVSLSADGRLLVGVLAGQLSTYRISASEPADPVRLAHVSGIKNASVSPTGVVAASTDDGNVVFYDSPSLRGTGQRIEGTGLIHQFAYSGDGQVLVIRGVDNRVRLVDMRQQVPVGDPISINGPLDANLALSPDGSQLALPDPRGILVWDLRSASWTAAACQVAGRELTAQEWGTYFEGLGRYHLSCPKRAA
jgi:DNA-binding SARP family transcriptional activator/WD40 repeat protein